MTLFGLDAVVSSLSLAYLLFKTKQINSFFETKMIVDVLISIIIIFHKHVYI